MALNNLHMTRTAASVHPGKKRRRGVRQIEPYLYLLPIFVVFGIFLYYPMIRTIHMSLSIVNSMGEVVGFAGLENFVELLTAPFGPA